MSLQRVDPKIKAETWQVDATSASETVRLPEWRLRSRTRAGLSAATLTVVRVDDSAHTVTVAPPAGWSLNGAADDTVTIPSGTSVFTMAGPAAWAGGFGVPDGTIGTADLRDSAVTVGKTSTAVQASLGKADGAAQKSANLTDLTSASSARTALGLGSAATMTPTSIAADAALTGTYARHDRDMTMVQAPSGGTVSSGVVLPVNPTPGQFDSGLLEAPSLWVDPYNGKLCMAYTGYTTGASPVASSGLATSDDGFTWTRVGQMFAASGVPGYPDYAGCTGPVVVVDGDTRHMFYIGLSAVGYEGGTKSICHATSLTSADPGSAGSWTRHGAVVVAAGTGWRGGAVWYPNFVRRGNLWYLFFNASSSGVDHYERCGYATSSTLDGPWTVHDADAPLLPETGHSTDRIWGGDPYVYATPDGRWRMDFSRANASWSDTGDYYATADDADFPLGWVVGGRTTNTSTNTQPFKGVAIYFRGDRMYYGSGPAADGVRLMSSPRHVDLATQQVITARKDFTHLTTINSDSTVVIGRDIQPATGPNRAKVTIGSTAVTGDIAEFIIGQNWNASVLLSWEAHTTQASAEGHLETYGGSNPLVIQNNAGVLKLGGTGGSVGFLGAAATARPAVTGSRGGNAALASLITALATLGLVTDSTSA